LLSPLPFPAEFEFALPVPAPEPAASPFLGCVRCMTSRSKVDSEYALVARARVASDGPKCAASDTARVLTPAEVYAEVV